MARRRIVSTLSIALWLLATSAAHAWVKPLGRFGAVFGPDGNMLLADGITLSKVEPRFGGTIWTSTPATGTVYGSGVDAAGDVLASGFTAGPDVDARVQKLDGTNGASLWTADVAGAGGLSDSVADVATDGAGDVLLRAYLRPDAFSTEIAGVKLSGADGSEQWRTVIGATETSFGGLAVAADGDAIIAGQVNDLLRVTRLDASDGSVVWSEDFAATGADATWAGGVAIDPAGDVVVTGGGSTMGVGTFFLVLKLAGSDGSELWRSEHVGPGGSDVVVDAAGDAIVCANSLTASTLVTKLLGMSGLSSWEHGFPNAACGRLVVAPGGDVIFGISEPAGFEVAVTRLSGSTGASLWRTDLEYDGNPRVALSADGLVGFSSYDMHGVLRADDGSHQIIDAPTFLCQQGEDKAAVKYAKRHLGALAECRDAINAGTLAITPAQCLSHPATASRQAAAGRAVRSTIAARCSDSVLGGLVACDTTLDGLIAPAGDGGCFVTLHDAGLDAALDAVYGTAPPPLPAAETACQAAIGRAAVGYAKTYYKGRRKEIEGFLRGKSFSPYDQRNANTRALVRANAKVAAVCTDALVAALSTCASTVDGIIYGCLRTAVEDAVEDALLSIYAP